MRWFSKSKPNSFTVAWSYTTAGILWRIVPSSLGYFIGEDRDTATKRVTFFCVNRVTGETCWSGKNFSEPWWIGIESVSGPMVFIHEYATPDMPDHQKIHAVNLVTGVSMWSNQELKFLFAHDDRVYAVQDLFDKRIFFALDMSTGNIISEVDREYLTSVQESLQNDRSLHIEYPVAFRETANDAAVHETVQFTLSRVRNPVQPEYLVKNNCLVVSYYENLDPTATESELQQNLVVTSLNTKKILYQDVIVNRAVAPVSDSFFCIDDYCYYVREKKTLTAVNLTAMGR